MRTDRRGFLRVLASAAAFVGRGNAFAGVRDDELDAHQETRNGLWGPLGERRPKLRRAPPPYRPYPALPRVALPPDGALSGAPLERRIYVTAPAFELAEGALTLEQLGHLLHYTNGLTGSMSQGSRGGRMRAAPSAGALYAGEIDVIVDRVTGVTPGHYYYDVRSHALVPLRKGSMLGLAADALAHPQAVSAAAALVLVSNVFARYTWRYANRGYRYALIDTGHIIENLRLTTRSMGLAELAMTEFDDDRLNTLLGLDGAREAVCAVCAVGQRGESRAASQAGAERVFVQRRHVPSLGSPTEGSWIERYHEATKLVAVESGQAVDPPRPIALESGARPAAPRIALAKRSKPTRKTIEACIDHRRSATRFSEQPLALGELSFVLEMAAGNAQLERAPGVELWLVANRVAGLAPGLYRYRDQGLETIRSGALGDEMVRACLGQVMGGLAAVGFLMVAQLGPEGERGRDRSYRDVLVEAGAIGQRLYLGAEALGRRARNLAAFRDDRLNALLRVDGRSRAVVHLTMLGPGE
jgi:SagB-type dehydrogenase family enzyme